MAISLSLEEEMNKAAQRWRNYGWYDYENEES